MAGVHGLTVEKFFTKFKGLWATIEERKSSSPSGCHVSIYKAFVKELGAREMTEKEEFVLEYIRLISNLCIWTGYISERWRLAINVMLQNKVDNIAI